MLTPADGDFLSVSDMGFMTAPRQADGSLPVLDFMRLSATSKFIDRGVDVMLPFAGTAPDLGCYETGLPTGGTGGGAGMGGGGGGTGGSAVGGSDVGGATPGGSGPTGGSTTAGSGPTSGAGGSSTATGGSPMGSGGSTTGTGGAAGSAPADGASSEAEPAGCGCATVGRKNGLLGVSLAALLFVATLRRRKRR
jgi:hypothetical protein